MPKNSTELQRIKSLTASELSDLYWNQKLSQTQIAKMFEVSPTAVRNLFKRHGIKSRTNRESQTAINHHRTVKLNYTQIQLILGCMLGDACLNREIYYSNKTGKELISYKLCIYHSNKFRDYVLHKRDIIGIGSKTKKLYKLNYRKSGFGSLMVGFCFCHTPTLKEISPVFLDTHYKKRLSNPWLEKIDWPAIAYWYQDDGSLQIGKNGRTIAFHTENFKEKEIKQLQELLLNFGLRTTIGKNNYNIEQRVILAHRKKEIHKFLENISPFIVPCMRYKLRSEGIVSNRGGGKICQQ